MKKSLRTILKKIEFFIINVLIFLVSITASILLLAVTANYWLSKKGYVLNESLKFSLDTAIYSPKYIFWDLSYCEQNQNCTKDTPVVETLVNRPISIFGEEYLDSSCRKILFLGDSFSTALYSDLSYSDYFSKKISEDLHQCIISLNIASPGTGNSQQLAKLEDNIQKINPDLIIWQFYWNDLNDNIQVAVHKIKNEELKREKAWRSFLFWAGYLNQNIPYLRESDLGTYLFSRATETDLFRNWPIDPLKDDEIKYNKEFIPLLLKKGLKIATDNSINLVTTISPLECQFINENSCDQWQIETNNILRNILAKDSNYIEMDQYLQGTLSAHLDLAQYLESTFSAQIGAGDTEKNTESTPSAASKKDLDALFSREEAATPGYRHLSPTGEAYFGAKLFDNFKNSGYLELLKR